MMIQTVKDYEFIGTPAPDNYAFIGTSATTKHIIPSLFPPPNETGSYQCLDIGFGRGELAQILDEGHPHVYIDGVDAWMPTCSNPKLGEVFRNVWCAKVEELTPEFLERYDYIFLMDVIEHLEKSEAEKLFKKLLLKMGDNTKLVISTPLWFFPQGHVEAGDFEEHKCFIPLNSFAFCKPILYNINPVDLVGMFVFNKESVFSASSFIASDLRAYGKHQALMAINSHNLYVDENWHKL